MRALLLTVLVFGALLPPVVEAGEKDDAGRPGLLPVSLGRAATPAPVTVDRAARPSSVTRDRAATLRPVTRKRAAGLRPVTHDRAAGLSPVTADRAAAPAAASHGRAAGLAPVTADRAAGLAPVTVDRAAVPASVSLGRTSGLLPVTTGRAAGLAPVTIDREVLLRAVGYDGAETRVAAFEDGILAPYGTLTRETEARLARTVACVEGETWGSDAHRTRVADALGRAGVAAPALLPGRLADALDALDARGPRRRGRLTFPAAYFLRPVAHGDGAFNKGWRAIVVGRDVAEVVPEDFERTLRKSNFPLVIGDIAFKNGDYVQAALAFREAGVRRPDAAAARFALSDALVALANYGYAADEIRAGLTLAPGWADDLDRRGVYGLAADLGRHLRALEKHLVEQPVAAAGWFLLGYLRMTSGDPELRGPAEEAFREALARDPDDAAAARFLRRLSEEVRPR